MQSIPAWRKAPQSQCSMFVSLHYVQRGKSKKFSAILRSSDLDVFIWFMTEMKEGSSLKFGFGHELLTKCGEGLHLGVEHWLPAVACSVQAGYDERQLSITI